jgi:hypothetical protein
MRKCLLALARAALMVGAMLFTPLANVTVSATPSSIRATFRNTNAVEHARTCLPKRVCGFRGCRYRQVCKRSQGN